MADVRLTATNPEDSSVVPVACNAKGELKLEEIPDQSFDGNLDGDLTVTGSATFAGDVKANRLYAIRQLTDDQVPGISNNTELVAFAWTAPGTNGNAPNVTHRFSADGSATFDGRVSTPQVLCAVTNSTAASYRVLNVYNTDLTQPAAFRASIFADGSATFSSGKAGFTAEGHLWCTTRRGDTVILDATSNGMGLWESYTPPSVRDQIKDAWAEKNALRPKPEESSRDEPATQQ